MIIGFLLLVSGIVIGVLLGLRWCDEPDCSEREEEIQALIEEVNRYKHWVGRVSEEYHRKHPEG